MPRTVCAVTLLAFGACSLFAQNPNDLSFRLRLTKDQPQYTVYEPITFEVSLSSSAERKYYASWTALVPFGGIKILLEPQTSAVDLQALQQGIIAGSILGSFGYLTPTPIRQTGDLTQWYRFEKAGHFRLSVAVDWVCCSKSADEGSGRERIHLQSNAVEFDIVPLDSVLEAQDLESILNDIDHSKSEQVRQEALHCLDLMQTPTAAQEKTRRYLASAHLGYSPYYSLLLHSSRLNQIASMLEQALRKPSVDPPPGIVDLLTDLQVRKQMGDPAARPANPAELEQWQADSTERTKLRQKLFARNSELLLDDIRLRSGPERLDAVFQAWSNAERQYGASNPTPDLLIQLRAEVLGMSQELLPEQQSQFLTNEWSKIPHADLLPLVRRVAMPNAPGAWARHWAFKFWCEDWPTECAKAMLADARESTSNLSAETILLIPEGEHPDLDLILEERLEDPKLIRSYGSGTSNGAVILRAASKNLKPFVDAFLDKQSSEQFRNCEMEGYLLGYLLRVAPADAEKRLENLLQDSKPDYCGGQALRGLAHASELRPAIPLIVAALNSPNLKTAGYAALFLGEHGSDLARPSLSKRLDALRRQWHDRAAEIASAGMSDEIEWNTAQLEKELVSALAHGQVWKLTAEEEQSLAAGCLTDECRHIAEGKSWLGL